MITAIRAGTLRTLALGFVCATGLLSAPAIGGSDSCPTDIDGNGATDVDDLVGVILEWNCEGPECLADTNGDEIVNVDDLVGVILAWGPCPIDGNDACAGAIPLTIDEPATGDTFDATADPEALQCDGNVVESGGVWYSVTGTGNQMTASLCEGTDFDTEIFIYCAGDDPENPCAGLGCIGTNDQSGECPNPNQSQFSWCSEKGRSYLIMISGWAGQTGNYTIVVTDDGTVCAAPDECVLPPPNGLCADATPLAPGESDSQNSTLAPSSPETFVCSEIPVAGSGGWYSVTGTGNTMTASLCDGTDFEAVVHVYCAGDDPENPCQGLLCIGADANGCGVDGPATFSWCSEADRAYLIFVSGAGSATGNYTIALSDSGEPCDAPAECTPFEAAENDECLSATAITSPLTPFSTINATTGGPNVCGAIVHDIWYTYTVACESGAGALTISTCPDDGAASDYDTDLNVFDASGGLAATCADLAGNLIECDDDGICDSIQLIPVFDGQELLIRLGGWQNEGVDLGTGELLVECIDADDDICQFATTVELDGGFAELQIDNCGATVDELSPICNAGVPDRPGRWLEVVGTGNTMAVTLCNLRNPGADTGDFVDTRLMVYCSGIDGPICDNLQCAADEPVDNNEVCPFTETLTWCTEAGRSYLILVQGADDFGSGCEGLVTVTFEEGAACDDPPCIVGETADSVEEAIDITDNINGDPVTGSNSSATPPQHDDDPEGGRDPELPAGSPSCTWTGNPDLAFGTVWYTFTAPGNGSVTLSTCFSPIMEDSIITIYSGTPGSLVEVACADDECVNFLSELITTELTPGELYYVCVANPGLGDSVPGQFQLDIDSP